MNESLRRALLRARLSEEDVAAHLQVNPKTVRRWLEGRIPYPRHRWALASLLGLEEPDLWPQLPQPWPHEVRAIYPHRDDIPRAFWEVLFESAEQEIDLLVAARPFLVQDSCILAILSDRTCAGVKIRICLPDSRASSRNAKAKKQELADRGLTEHIRDELLSLESIGDPGAVEVRLHRAFSTESIYRVDDECLVNQRLFGTPDNRTPVIHLHRADHADMFASYHASFVNTWMTATRLNTNWPIAD